MSKWTPGFWHHKIGPEAQPGAPSMTLKKISFPWKIPEKMLNGSYIFHPKGIQKSFTKNTKIQINEKYCDTQYQVDSFIGCHWRVIVEMVLQEAKERLQGQSTGNVSMRSKFKCPALTQLQMSMVSYL